MYQQLGLLNISECCTPEFGISLFPLSAFSEFHLHRTENRMTMKTMLVMMMKIVLMMDIAVYYIFLFVHWHTLSYFSCTACSSYSVTPHHK